MCEAHRLAGSGLSPRGLAAGLAGRGGGSGWLGQARQRPLGCRHRGPWSIRVTAGCWRAGSRGRSW